VSFKIAESLTLLDAARGLNRLAGEAAWEVVNLAMQVLGGVDYTNIFPVERLLCDVRLLSIWTGTNEIMNLIIQHEFYKDFLHRPPQGRDVKADAEATEEKAFPRLTACFQPVV